MDTVICWKLSIKHDVIGKRKKGIKMSVVCLWGPVYMKYNMQLNFTFLFADILLLSLVVPGLGDLWHLEEEVYGHDFVNIL